MVQLSGTLGQLRDLLDVKINPNNLQKVFASRCEGCLLVSSDLACPDQVAFLNGGECSDSGNEGQGDKESEDRD